MARALPKYPNTDVIIDTAYSPCITEETITMLFGITVAEEQAPTTVFGSTCCVSDALWQWGCKTGKDVHFSTILLVTLFPCIYRYFGNMQPLNVCLSYQGTLNTVERISEDHQVEVQMWADELLPVVKTSNPVSIAT